MSTNEITSDYRARKCVQCNSGLPAQKIKYCSMVCKNKYYYLRKKRNRPTNPPSTMLVVERAGDFRKGAEFTATDVRESAKLGVWPPGIRFRDSKTGKLFTVIPDTNKHAGPQFEWDLQPQKLVRAP